ncbi:hypothetical protein OQA88_13162 [Cercophora sp. LCS_1]
MLYLTQLLVAIAWPVIAIAQPANLAGVVTHPFDLSSVSLTDSRWTGNQNRTINYLKFIDVERLLYNFRANHRLAQHQMEDATCRERATYFVAELAKCQANNAAAGFSTGYLSGFPESEIAAVEARTLSNGNVPYYAIHKTMAGLLDVWRILDDRKAGDVLLALAGWVDARTARLSYAQMQTMLGTEFGGMNDVLTEIHQQTGDKRWLSVAQRFDHAAVFDPLASNRDQLSGLHANTQVPKWIGAAREYQSTGNTRYRDIARNAWKMTVEAHSYAIGGNSQAEHFRPPNAISQHLAKDTAEGCNTYNMLKLTRELWRMDPNNTEYFDFYERALINHMLGWQNPADSHGHITYFTSLNPGGRRGVGPAWGGGTWSTDYQSFWCCQGTGLETNTKLMDSIYFHADSTLFVNLFTPSVLKWAERNTTVQQITSFPVQDTVSLVIQSQSAWELRVRIPSWTSAAEVSINGERVPGTVTSGAYFSIARAWGPGDKVVIRLPMKLRLVPANDKTSVAAIAYGPVVLSGNYGNSALSSMPSLSLDSLRRLSSTSLDFAATADGKAINLGPFYDAHGFNYNVYWMTTGKL